MVPSLASFGDFMLNQLAPLGKRVFKAPDVFTNAPDF